jgi:Ca2+-binding EF-hand superfamily protein
VLIYLHAGSPDEKLRMFFDMYDVSGDGKLDRDEFKLMIE